MSIKKTYYWETKNSRRGGHFLALNDKEAKETMLKIMESRPTDTLLCLYYEIGMHHMFCLYDIDTGWEEACS